MPPVLKKVLGSTGLIILLALTILPAYSQSSLGIGAAEPQLDVSGPFGSIIQWINIQQQSFYRLLTNSLRDMRQDSSKIWILAGLSFVYGVFHAAGPGHGKAVISSYMLANEVQLRRGIYLSFASSGLQAVSAITIISIAFLLLRGTAISMTDATHFLEIASYALITCFGAWLVWRKLKPLLLLNKTEPRDEPAHEDHHHHDETCGCGHSHAPDPTLLDSETFSWKSGLSAIIAVGLRPCSGALIVLSFSFINGLWFGGIISVIAMAFGTALTVSTLATMAVGAKNWAVSFTDNDTHASKIHTVIELAGALFVMVIGALMLVASLNG